MHARIMTLAHPFFDKQPGPNTLKAMVQKCKVYELKLLTRINIKELNATHRCNQQNPFTREYILMDWIDCKLQNHQSTCACTVVLQSGVSFFTAIFG